ncbi:MAG: hypothetical protein HC845_01625 [Akkermansiaceae bacterium]|nr:hypothetical protein [Akkermansiaceae bacterium]
MKTTIALAAGRDASSFKIASTAKLPDPPKVPTLFPHELLRRRPDVAVAERRMEAAYSAVGVAKSDGIHGSTWKRESASRQIE